MSGFTATVNDVIEGKSLVTLAKSAPLRVNITSNGIPAIALNYFVLNKVFV